MAVASPVELAGGPVALGTQHGAALGANIRINCDKFLRSSEQIFGTPYQRIRSNVDILLHFLPEEHRQEICAVAEAAQVSYEELVALNTLLDTDTIVESEKSYCINVVAYGPATADGRLAHGRNLDFPGGGILENTAEVFVYRPERGNAFLSVAWAGFIGAVTGMNEHGLTATEITSRTPCVSKEGVPLMILLRMILQYADTIEAAIEIIRSSPRTGGFNITLTDWRVPEAVCVEFDAEKVGIRRAQKSVLVVSENRLAAVMSKGQRLSPSGVARHIRACDLADAHYGQLTPEVMMQILRDRWDPIYRREGKSHNSLCSNHSLQSVVFLPEESRAWVSNRHVPAPDHEYVEYRLASAAHAGEVAATPSR